MGPRLSYTAAGPATQERSWNTGEETDACKILFGGLTRGSHAYT
jgi:hypothetical protein